MATPARLTGRIDGDLAAVEGVLAELSEVDREWETLPETVSVEWSLDWDQAMSTFLRLLARAYRRGAMSPTQADRYRRLLAGLKAATPILKRRELRRPPVALDCT